MATTPSRTGHLPINGLSLYHEVYGELGASRTSPLLLIPGALMATDSMTSWVSAFAPKRAVIVFDQQGHGRTADTSRTMSWEQFADDAAALLRALKVERADVMGYSDGGGVALQLALRHPTLVNKLVSLSGTYRKDGWYPSVLENSDGRLGDQNVSDAQMRSISAKTMIIVGDADSVKPEHALAMFKLRGGGDEEAAASGMLRKVPAARLVILPAMSHLGIFRETAVLAPMVSAFLDDVAPATPDLFSASPAQRERDRPPVVDRTGITDLGAAMGASGRRCWAATLTLGAVARVTLILARTGSKRPPPERPPPSPGPAAQPGPEADLPGPRLAAEPDICSELQERSISQ